MNEPLKTEKTDVKFVEVSTHEVGQRVDNFLMAQFRALPKSRIYQMIRKGEVRVNKGRVKPETRLKLADIVRVPPVVLPSQTEIDAIPIFRKQQLLDAIIHEDERILVINKPSGIAVHKGSGIPFGVIEILREARPELDFLELVHRLDRDTSGCLILAKNGQILKQIQRAEMKKKYLCLVAGHWNKGIFDQHAKLDIENRAGGERHVIVSKNGKDAHTRFRLVEHYPESTLLEAELFTGRTHQIRVHTQASNHPILGDSRYGDEAHNKRFKQKGLNRLFLHAHSLMLELPPFDYAFSAPLPTELSDFLSKLKS